MPIQANDRRFTASVELFTAKHHLESAIEALERNALGPCMTSTMQAIKSLSDVARLLFDLGRR